MSMVLMATILTNLQQAQRPLKGVDDGNDNDDIAQFAAQRRQDRQGRYLEVGSSKV